MKLLLGMYEFEKLDAIVNGVCLSILIVLYAFHVKNAIPSTLVILLAALIVIIIRMIIVFLWTRKAERILLESGGKFWNVRRITIFLSISFTCTVVGILTISISPSNHIAVVMILVLSIYFGTNLGRVAKIAFKYKKT